MDKKVFPLKYFLVGTLILYSVIFSVMKTDSFYFHADTYEYVAIANNILDHHVFSRQLPEHEIIRTPGYPILIAGAMMIAGREDFTHIIILVQTIFVAITAWLIARMGAGAFGNIRSGNISAIIYILLPTTIWYTMVGMTEITFTLLFITALSLRRYVWGGAMIGLAILIRPIAMLSPLLIAPFLFKKRLRAGVLFLIGLALVVTPWVARNYDLGFGATIAYIGPFNLAHGNATKFYAWRNGVSNQTALDKIQAEVDTLILNKNIRPDIAHMQVAKKYIFADPPTYVLFHAIKTIPFFVSSSFKEATTAFRSPDSSQNTSDLFIRGSGILQKLWREAPFTLESLLRGIITLLMLCGTWRAWKEKNSFALLLFAIILLFSALSSPWASPRFRLPFEPYIFLLAFYGASWIKSKILLARSSQVNGLPS